MDVRATFQLTAHEYRSPPRNSPAIRTMLIISPLMAAFGLSSPVGCPLPRARLGTKLTGPLICRRYQIRWYNARSWR